LRKHRIKRVDHKFFILEKLVRIDKMKGKPRFSRKGNQPYDTSFKQWVKNDPQTIIPVLLPGAEFVEALDIERIRPTMRADRVFKIRYNGELRILNTEFETGYDEDLPARLLVYNAILYYEFKLPVMSLIIYPFRTTMAVSPLQTGKEGELVTFHFDRLPLFGLEARTYIQKHITCMYPLVPAMQGANAAVIEDVVSELAELYREDEVTLAEQLVLMELLLSRTTTISKEEKAKIEGSLKMYDPLWEEHPKVKRIKAQAKADAQAEVQAKVEKAKVEIARTNFLQVVRARFPELAALAEQSIEKIDSPDMLQLLLVQVASAANETVARNILHPSAA
jgi:hypothetical protein